MRKLGVASLATFALVIGGVWAAEGLKSGPQTGEKVPGPFHPLNVTGESAGEKQCLYCKNGTHPVAMVFARSVDEPVVNLLKRIDVATGEHKDAKMGSFVVFLDDSDGMVNRLKEVAEKENLKNIVLSVDKPEGPRGYNVNKEADVTVVLYTDHVVKANYAFPKGGLKDKDIDQIVGDVSKILP